MTRLFAKIAAHLAGTAVIASASLAGCGGPTLKEGSVEDLLSGEATEEVPLETRALRVERTATELPPQVDEYLVGPNDILDIVVLGHPEFSSPRDANKGVVGTPVRKDGKVYFPIVGGVEAAGHSVEDFQEILREKLAAFVKEPHLTVDVIAYESQKFYVLGEVDRPGVFPVDGDTTLLEAIGLAGGVKPEGNLEAAYVVRDRELLPINLADVLLRGDTSRNIYMRDKDLVFVPPASDQMVYVLGEVAEPGTVQIRSGRLSLGQALAEAGGPIPTDASERSIKLIRGSWQEPTVYTLDLDTILAYGDRIMLAPGDRIVVDPSALTVMTRYMKQILPFLQGLDYATRTYGRIVTMP